MGELDAETKSMSTHAQTQRDYSPHCDTASGTQKGQGIVAGLTLLSLHTPREMLLDFTSNTQTTTVTFIQARGQKDSEAYTSTHTDS